LDALLAFLTGWRDAFFATLFLALPFFAPAFLGTGLRATFFLAGFRAAADAFFFTTFFFAAFFTGFFAFLLVAMIDLHQDLIHPRVWRGTSVICASKLRLLAPPVCHEILVQNIRIETYSRVPDHGGRGSVNRCLAKAFYVTPGTKSTDLEQIPQKDTSFDAIVKSEPQPVVAGSLALHNLVHAHLPV
jgi:hypothetical protein